VTVDAVEGWSPRQLDTLATLAEAFAPGFAEGDYRRRARQAAETLNAVADPDDLRQLRLVTTALDTPVVNLLIGGRRRRLADLDPAGRDRLLLQWAGSRLAQRRTAFQAFKRLSLFLAWTDTGADGDGNPAWPEIGYVHAEPVAVPSASIAPLAVDRSATEPLALEADVVVVGSGAGGSVVAARLLDAGREVLVVEAGPYLSEADMPVDEGEAFRRLYLDRGTTSTADLGITIVAGAGVGGGTTINWTTCFAPPDWLRDEWASEHGLDGFAGGQTDADLVRLRAELDIQPPSSVPPKDRAILDGAAALGWEHAVTERNAGPCTDCGACGFGCRAGAKRSALRAHLAAAHAGGARVLADATVEQVTFEGGVTAGVRGWLRSASGEPGRAFTVRARQVVVAAGALRTPLVLASSGVEHPELGANLRLHPAPVVIARMPDPVQMWLGPLQAARSLEFVRPGPATSDGLGPRHGGFFIETGPAHPGLIASAFPWEGGEASRRLMRGARFLIPLGAALRDVSAGRVRWSRRGRPRIDYQLADADRRTAARATVELSRLGRAAGAVELIVGGTPPDRFSAAPGTDVEWAAFLGRRARADFASNRAFFFSAHQMGTARAGADPRSHPCDPHGRVRAGDTTRLIEGLYVADGSLFPTAAGVNPMVTIMALAERTARAILADG
jgi:choline dehydrogenase-like flavoprotein